MFPSPGVGPPGPAQKVRVGRTQSEPGTPGRHQRRSSTPRNSAETPVWDHSGMALPALAGWTVGITADRRWEEQAELLGRRGAQVVHGPSVRTLPLDLDDGLRRATGEVIARPPDIVVLNTAVGTRAWIAAAESTGVDDA